MHLGIDFGTTFSSAALFVNGEIKRVKEPLRSGYSYPSSAFVDKEGKVFVGQAAENQRGQDPSSYRREFKRDLGQKTPSSLGNRKFLPEDLVSEMLKVLKQEAEEMVNRQRIESAIVTIPASYAGYRAELMEQAARDAGFKQVQLLPEPVAAAIYYDRGQPLADGERLLVYDLGGGTFDAALMEKRGDRFELLAQPVGDERLGGSDFDTAIYNHLRQNCSQTLSQLLDPSQRDARAIRTRLKVVDWLRDFKHQLSVVEAHTDDLPVGDFDVYTLSRETFQGLIHQQLQTTSDLCDRLVRDAGLKWNQVGRVLLVGGSCRIPYVRQLLEKRFNCNVVRVDEPELAVCLGAAIYQDVTTSKRVEAERLRQEAQERERIKAEQKFQRLEAMLREEQLRRMEVEQQAKTNIKSLPAQPVYQHPVDVISLESEKGVDYRNLRDLLKVKKWREADEETRNVMLKATNRESKGSLSSTDLFEFPIKDLRTIDRLWVAASNGHFGFTAQKKIWKECGSPGLSTPTWFDNPFDIKNVHKFANRLGWLDQDEGVDYIRLKFDTSLSPVGELPVVLGGTTTFSTWGGTKLGFVSVGVFATNCASCLFGNKEW
jgi:actin-like ATPase involved in cell morphogenesis